MSERNYYVICDDNCKFPAMTKEEIITAITEATGTTPTDIDGAFITKIKELNEYGTLKWWVGTQAEYNALAEKDPFTLYIITDGNDLEELEAELKSLADSLADMQGNVTELQDSVTTLQEQHLRSFSYKDFDQGSMKAAIFATRSGDTCSLTVMVKLPANETAGPTTETTSFTFTENLNAAALREVWQLGTKSALSTATVYSSMQLLDDNEKSTARLRIYGGGNMEILVKLPVQWAAGSSNAIRIAEFCFSSYQINSIIAKSS